MKQFLYLYTFLFTSIVTLAATENAEPSAISATETSIPSTATVITTENDIPNDMENILSARIGKKFVYFRANKDELDFGMKKGDEDARSLIGFAKSNDQFRFMEEARDPLTVTQVLETNGLNVLAVQIVFHPVDLDMLKLMKNMPENVFSQSPSLRVDTFFVIADQHQTQANFIRKMSEEDPRVLETSVFYPGATLVLSNARYQHLCTKFSKSLEKMRSITLTKISRRNLTNSVFVKYDCRKDGEQLVTSSITNTLLYTTDLCDCLCICARSPSQNKGIMAHINHAALANRTVFKGFVDTLRKLGEDMEVIVLSSYLSAPLEKMIPTLNVLSKNVVVQCFPIVFERNENSSRTIVDTKQLTYDQVSNICGETSGGLTVLFNPQTGQIDTDITKIKVSEKMKRLA
ncbi:MAG: hypothetical protein KBD31_01710 [Proteobacteria bacterium]|nr:hypothetical protein [Pseudomonadota bacterium]